MSRAAQGDAPRLQPSTIANAATPATPAAPAPNPGRGSNARIIQLMDDVCAQEAALKNVQPARSISCIALPKETGSAAVLQSRSNAVDLLLDAAKLAQDGDLAFVSPADTHYVGGALDARVRPGFQYSGLLLEETYCTLVSGAKRSLDGAAASYPLGQNSKHQHLLHSSDLRFRHDHRARLEMLEVTGSSHQRIAAQREIMINTLGSEPANTGPGMHMFSIAGVDRRGVARFNYKAMYEGMLRQLAHAFTTASSNGVKTIVLTLPGSGEYSRESRAHGAEPDRNYIHSLACAAADAIHYFGGGLSVVIPTHGPLLDDDIQNYLKYLSASPGLQGDRYFDIKAAQQKQPVQVQAQNNPQQGNPTPQQVQPVPPVQPKQPGLLKQLKKINPLKILPNIGKANQQVPPQQPAKAPSVSPAQKPVVPPPVPAKPKYIQAPAPAQHNAVMPQTPMQNVPLEDRKMGRQSYKVEFTNEATVPNSEAATVLGSLIGDGSKITLRRVHGLPNIAHVPPNATYEIKFSDPSKDGRALLSIRTTSSEIEVYEAVFSSRHLSALANLVKAAPAA